MWRRDLSRQPRSGAGIQPKGARKLIGKIADYTETIHPMPSASPNPIVLYDGVCGFCNRIVQFILKRDSRDRFRFATLQSEYARRLLQKHGISTEQLETLYLVLDNGQP